MSGEGRGRGVLDREPQEIVGAVLMNAPIEVLGRTGKVTRFRLGVSGKRTRWELRMAFPSPAGSTLDLSGYVSGYADETGLVVHEWTLARPDPGWRWGRFQ